MKEVTGVDILGTETNCRQAMAKTEFEYECGEYTTTEDKVVSRTTWNSDFKMWNMIYQFSIKILYIDQKDIKYSKYLNEQ